MANLIYITFVEPEGPYIKVWGQCDKTVPVAIEDTLLKLQPVFDEGEYLPTAENFQIGALCCAKFKDGVYYRARIINTSYMTQGMVEVMFIDYGNKDFVPYNNIRAFNHIPVQLISIPAQAQEFILANVTHQEKSGWDIGTLELISNEIRYLDLHFQLVGQVGPHTIISLYNNNQDLSINFLNRGCISSVPVPVQQMVLQTIIGKPPPVRAPVNMVMQQHMVTTPAVRSPLALQSPPLNATLLSYKSLPLEMGSEHPIYVSYVTDGPCLFSVQLKKFEDKLRELMEQINSMQLLPFEEPPLPGTVCVARSSEDNYICRAVVTSMVDCNFKVFYVDFGNTELLPFSQLFQIPFKYVIPKVMANRFTLAGLTNSAVSIDMKCAFKKFVDNELIYMQVKTPATGTSLASCEIRNKEGIDALSYVLSIALLSYSEPVPLTRGPSLEIKVSFVYGCKRFYIQLKNKETELNSMMQNLQEICLNSPPINKTGLQVNMPCNAFYEGDGMFYRAQIIELADENIRVRYIDYGNEELVNLANVKPAFSDLITILRPQAIECCLNGYQNMEVDEERDNLLEDLILEQDFIMKVSEIQSGRALVELFNGEHYNVASLLLEKIAVTRSQVSPMLVQENSQVEHRRRTPPASQNTKYSRNESENDGNERTFNKRTDYNRNRNDNETASFQKPNTDFKPRNNNRNDDSSGSYQKTTEKSYETKPEYKRRDNRSADSDTKSDFPQTKKRYESSDNKPDFKKPHRDREADQNWSGSEPQNYRNKDKGAANRPEYKPKYNQNTNMSNADGDSWEAPEEVLDLAPADSTFPVVDYIGKTENVSISWFHNPTNFFVQIANSKGEFSTIMKEIQTVYKKRQTFKPEVGAPVIALFPEDGAMYRAVILEVLSPQYKVFYVDFGNTSIVRQVYPIENKYIKLPAQAAICSLGNIKPNGDNWPTAKDLCKYFDKDLFQCTFLSTQDNIYYVELKSNQTIIKEELIEAKLALEDIPENPNENFDISLLLGQQILCHIGFINNLSDLMIQLQPGLFVRCGLHNLENATEKWEDDLLPWLGHFVIIYVDNVIDDRLEVTLYDSNGIKLKLIEPDEGAFDSVLPLCAMPILSPYLQGYVSHATPTTIFIQPTKVADNIAVLLERLYQHYNALEPETIEPEEEMIYAVHSTDENWYRGKVLVIEEDNATVQYIDYGNTEVVSKSVLRNLDETFNETHMLAIEIAIDDSEALLDQEVDISIIYGDDGWVGTLQSTEIPALEGTEAVMTEAENVETQEQIIDPTPEMQVPDPTFENIEDPNINEVPSIGFSVILSHSDNPSQFFLQLSDDSETIANLQEALQLEIPNLPDMETVTAGVLCAAPYSADGEWYRAQVLDADSEYVSVRFVDYGNTDTVMDSTTKLKTLPPELLALEQHARKFSLYLKPTEEEWSCEACAKFEELTDVENLAAEIIHQDEKVTYVDLYANGVNIADVMKAEKFAVQLELEKESSCTGFISHTNSPSEFWIQLESSCSDLERVADQLVSAEGYPELVELAPGALCAAIFPDDESWYRARILSNTVAGLEVLFIDYGNSCTSTKLRELPEDLIMLPALAQKCCLQKPAGILQWPAFATSLFKELGNEGAAVFTVNKLSPGETSVVQLLLEGEDICTKFLPETVDGVITNFLCIEHFYIQKTENFEKVSAISKKLEDSVNWPKFDETDKFVCALHPDDGKWYRATISSEDNGKYEVTAIDYGYLFVSEDIRKLMEDTDKEEPYSNSCSLDTLPGFKWGDETDRILKEMRTDGQTVFQVEFVNERDVRLYRFGIDIRNNLDIVKCTPIGSVNSTPKKQTFKRIDLTADLGIPYSPIPDTSNAKLFTSGDVTMFSDYETINDNEKQTELCKDHKKMDADESISIEVVQRTDENNISELYKKIENFEIAPISKETIKATLEEVKDLEVESSIPAINENETSEKDTAETEILLGSSENNLSLNAAEYTECTQEGDIKEDSGVSSEGVLEKNSEIPSIEDPILSNDATREDENEDIAKNENNLATTVETAAVETAATETVVIETAATETVAIETVAIKTCGTDSNNETKLETLNHTNDVLLDTSAEQEILYNKNDSIQIPKYTTPIEMVDDNKSVPRNSLNLLEELKCEAGNGLDNILTKTELESNISISDDEVAEFVKDTDFKVKKEIDKNVTV